MGKDTNDLARSFFGGTVMRSFQTSPRLKERTFANHIPVFLGGRSTAVLQFDMPRFNSIMEAIANALYRRDYGENFGGKWWTFSPSMFAPSRRLWDLPDGYEEIRQLLSRFPWTPVNCTNPQVFKYEVAKDENDCFQAFKFEFYEGFIIYAVKENE